MQTPKLLIEVHIVKSANIPVGHTSPFAAHTFFGQLPDRITCSSLDPMGRPEAAVKHARNDGCFKTPFPITDDGSLMTVTLYLSCPIAQEACTSRSPYLPN